MSAPKEERILQARVLPTQCEWGHIGGHLSAADGWALKLAGSFLLVKRVSDPNWKGFVRIPVAHVQSISVADE